MSNRILVSTEEGMEEPEWLSKVEGFMLEVLERLEFDGEEISVLFCRNELIHSLNKEYRDMDSATDILSFEGGDEYTDEDGLKWINAGDMIISVETLAENAAYFGVDENEELKRLLVHGILHLNGYDHGEEHIDRNVPPTDPMLVLQESVLKEFSDRKIK